MSSQITPSKTETKPPVRRTEDVFDMMRREIDSIFDRWMPAPALGFPAPAMPKNGFPAETRMDVSETEKEYVIEAELPGVDQKDIKVTIENGILSLRGEKRQEREEKKDDYHLSERSFGSFERAVRLPGTVDDAKVDARFENGVLRIVIAKSAGSSKPQRTIEIKKG